MYSIRLKTFMQGKNKNICFLIKNGYNNNIYVTNQWRYLIMKGQIDTQYGQILIDTDVIAT